MAPPPSLTTLRGLRGTCRPEPPGRVWSSKPVHRVRGGGVPSVHSSVIRVALTLASVSLVLLGSCAQPRVGVDVGIVYRGGPAPGNSDVLRPGGIKILTADGE